MATTQENLDLVGRRMAKWVDSKEVLRAVRRIVELPKGWRIRRLSVARVFPSKPVGFGAQYDIELANGSAFSRGSLYLSPLRNSSTCQSNRVALRSSGPLQITGLAVWVEGDRMLLHTPDRDPSLPRLREAITVSRMTRQLKLRRPRRCRILSYRPGRRCTIAYGNKNNHGGFVVGKLYNNGLATSVPALQQKLRATLGKCESSPRLPRILTRLPSLGMVVTEGLSATEPTAGIDPLERAVAAGRVLGNLHGSGMVPDKAFTSGDELNALDRWLELLSRLGRKSEVAATLRQWLGSARRNFNSGRRCFLHRDFYDNQILKTDAGWALVDFDTAAAGDRELDVANYLAHLYWREIREGKHVMGIPRAGTAFLASYRRRVGRARLSGPRLRFYLVASLLRVATIHSLRTGEGPAARRLIHIARQCTAVRPAEFSPLRLGGSV